VRTADFHYELPPELIAQHPVPRRDGSRLLVLHRSSRRVEHRQFRELTSYLQAGDVLVLNDSRVIPARLRGFKPASGGQVEVLLVSENAPNDWWAMLRPGKRVRAGTRIEFRPPASDTPSAAEQARLTATVTAKNDEGHCRLHFEGCPDVRDELSTFGEVPLPPYIERASGADAADLARYQTVFARPPGSVAAPTAGLHFTHEILAQIHALGAQVHFVTLHVGLGTFAPVKAGNIEEHVMHEEVFELPAGTAEAVNLAKAEGRRVIAVGTTSVRVLESAVAPSGATVQPQRGRTRIFIHPPARFRIVDALLTNFHLPESTLLMLVSAFAAPGELGGREIALAAYAGAVRERYRFFSYGDAMLLL
jgi:S-adenosylmethionine:tRNA ribosyltransferase-isomerase